jgi:hypothetical protein
LKRKSERLDALEHFVEGIVKLAVLGHAPPKNRFQISQVGDVNDLSTRDERAIASLVAKRY